MTSCIARFVCCITCLFLAACPGERDADSGAIHLPIACSYVGAPDGGIGPAPGSLCSEYGGAVLPTECPGESYIEIDRCPEAGRTGRCEVRQETSSGQSTTTMYSYDGASLEGVRAACDAASGTFTTF